MDLNAILRNTYWGSSLSFNYGNGHDPYFNSNPLYWSLEKMDIVYGTGDTAVVQFTNLKYKDKKVCERIAFKNASIIYKSPDAQPRTYQLPLFPEYKLKEYSIVPGTQAPDNSYWNAATFHAGVLIVFGYELTPGGKWIPITQQIYDSMDFMPLAGQPPVTLNQKIKAGQSCDVTMEPLRVVLCVELACLDEQYNFEPTGALNSVMVHPHTMLMSNMKLEQANMDVEIMRPALANHDHSNHGAMGQYIKAALFTDQNETNPLVNWPPPLKYFYKNSQWPQLFAYYHTDPAPNDKYRVIDANQPKRSILANREVFENVDADGNAEYQPTNFVKERFQGSFDNIHLAPPMDARYELAPGFYTNPENLEKIVNITMAPVCQHDCVHLHWRWGKYSGSASRSRWNGWGEKFPFEKAGGPLVPQNQTVDMELLAEGSSTARGFVYRATMQNVQPGTCQFVFHHGFAYALGFNPNLAAGVFFDHLQKHYLQEYIDAGYLTMPTSGEIPWSVFYLAIHFGLGNGKLFNRVVLRNPEAAVYG